MISTTFKPDTTRAKAIDHRMRDELAKSLAQILGEIRQQQPALARELPLNRLQESIEFLDRDIRVSPAMFAHYYQLVFSILENHDDLAERIIVLADSAVASSPLQIMDLSGEALGSESIAAIYRQAFDNDESVRYGFLAPRPDKSLETKAAVERALRLMQQAVPDLHGEILAIISEILLAAPPEGENVPRFDGASAYQLWGALVLNTDEPRSDVEMLETLAHECGHSLLFGLTVEEPLVLNDDSERFRSPLRTDPRPMDGIFHATFVSARMHYAMQELSRFSGLDEEQKKECESFLAASRKAFYDGYAVVSEHARYSDTGNEIMQNALDYMQEVSESAAAIA